MCCTRIEWNYHVAESQAESARFRPPQKAQHSISAYIWIYVRYCLCLLFGQFVLDWAGIKWNYHVAECWVNGWVSNIQPNSENSAMDLSIYICRPILALFVLVCAYFLVNLCCTWIWWNYHVAESMTESATFRPPQRVHQSISASILMYFRYCLCLLGGPLCFTMLYLCLTNAENDSNSWARHQIRLKLVV